MPAPPFGDSSDTYRDADPPFVDSSNRLQPPVSSGSDVRPVGFCTVRGGTVQVAVLRTPRGYPRTSLLDTFSSSVRGGDDGAVSGISRVFPRPRDPRRPPAQGQLAGGQAAALPLLRRQQGQPGGRGRGQSSDRLWCDGHGIIFH